ncbi:hypothetical protein Mapa_010527 [Marchantia paleacea]|nr:hypothetical protein Mapa_010527 [Marchantia paleacea]
MHSHQVHTYLHYCKQSYFSINIVATNKWPCSSSDCKREVLKYTSARSDCNKRYITSSMQKKLYKLGPTTVITVRKYPVSDRTTQRTGQKTYVLNALSR